MPNLNSVAAQGVYHDTTENLVFEKIDIEIDRQIFYIHNNDIQIIT